jgi:hypothetical protein
MIIEKRSDLAAGADYWSFRPLVYIRVAGTIRIWQRTGIPLVGHLDLRISTPKETPTRIREAALTISVAAFKSAIPGA